MLSGGLRSPSAFLVLFVVFGFSLRVPIIFARDVNEHAGKVTVLQVSSPYYG